jgi:hypothetical protein
VSPAEPYRLHRGHAAPVQQSRTTCGSASLTVARMLADPAFAQWIAGEAGEGGAAAGGGRGGAAYARFTAYEQQVLRRTNGLFPPSPQNHTGRSTGGVLTGPARRQRLNIPWPHALGTSPLGALREIEQVAAAGGTRYQVQVIRWHRPQQLDGVYRSLAAAVSGGLPALLYVGNTLLPRHVVLLVAAGPPARVAIDVYDPATGQVGELDPDSFADRRLGLGGWDVPWLVLRPGSAPVG